MKTIRFVTGKRTNWPFSHMQVGESFLVNKADRYQTARSLAHYYGQNGRQFTANIIDKGLKVTRQK